MDLLSFIAKFVWKSSLNFHGRSSHKGQKFSPGPLKPASSSTRNVLVSTPTETVPSSPPAQGRSVAPTTGVTVQQASGSSSHQTSVQAVRNSASNVRIFPRTTTSTNVVLPPGTSLPIPLSSNAKPHDHASTHVSTDARSPQLNLNIASTTNVPPGGAVPILTELSPTSQSDYKSSNSHQTNAFAEAEEWHFYNSTFTYSRLPTLQLQQHQATTNEEQRKGREMNQEQQRDESRPYQSCAQKQFYRQQILSENLSLEIEKDHDVSTSEVSPSSQLEAATDSPTTPLAVKSKSEEYLLETDLWEDDSFMSATELRVNMSQFQQLQEEYVNLPDEGMGPISTDASEDLPSLDPLEEPGDLTQVNE